MRASGLMRITTAVAIATLVMGVTTAAGSGNVPAPRRAADLAGPDPQDLPASGERNWTGVSTDIGRTKPPPAADAFAPPSVNHAPDVPGQHVASAAEPTGPIVTAPGISTAEIARIRAAITTGGAARVNVTTGLPAGLTSRASVTSSQRASVKAALDALAARVSGPDARELARISVYPWASYEVTDAGLEALVADPAVTSVTLDSPISLALAESTAIIRSNRLNQAGTRGDGWVGSPVGANEVVIIDSGVDNDHAAFAGRVIAEACFSTGSDCPGGGTSETGPDTGDNCTYSPRCDHGTHAASIAAGSFFSGGHEGVARGARIVAIQVGTLGGDGWTALISDINLALDYALDRKTGGANVVAVNLSLHTVGLVRTSACDAENGDFAATQALAANLQSAGVAVVAAAGNDTGEGVSYPACLSSVFAVSSTNDADQPSATTNAGALTDWWAPGVMIDAAVPGTNAHANRSGTSAAAPHVTGAFALLRQCVDGNGNQITNATAISRLNATGKAITVDGVTRKRINIQNAAAGLVNNNDFANPEGLPTSGMFNDFDFNICSDVEFGEPGPFSIDNGVWWTLTPAATSTAIISTDDGGGNVTTFDTTLTVYTGSTLATLRPIASDDDSGVGLRSLVTVPVNAGVTYRIKVDGFGGATGLLNLHLELNAAPTCQGVAATIVGYAVDDVITGTAGNDVIVAGPGNDQIMARGGDDRICADAGDDTVGSGSGNDVAFGGAGADDITGSQGNDTLLGNPGGGSTDDVGDVIRGGPGNDTLDGWTGKDRLFGGPGNDLLIGAADIDTIEYTSAAGAVTVDLLDLTATGGDGNDTLSAIENAVGSPFGDVLNGDGAVNVLSGFTGADTIRGRGQNDLVRGQDGHDSLFGGTGNDSVLGGIGNDFVRGEEGNDALNGEAGVDSCQGGPGTDTATPSCETVTGVP
jgi:Ca2+-binding RTX toxin-like protein